MFISADLFSTLINVGATVALAVGGARLVWLFLSPTPRAVSNTVRRRGGLTSGRLGLVLFTAGCVFVAIAIATMRHLLSLPHSLWNIVPLAIVWLSALAGCILLASAIITQSVLVDAYRGVQEADWGQATSPNLEGLALVGLALALAAAGGFHWLGAVDIATADLPGLKQRTLFINILFYWTLIAAGIRHYREQFRTQEAGQIEQARWMAWFGLPLLLAVFGGILRAALPSEHGIERFAADPASHFDVSGALWRGSLLALPGLALAALVIARLAARALPVGAARKQPEGWTAALYCAACLMLATVFAHWYVRQHPAPDVAFDVWIGFALPLAVGMAGAPLLGPGARLSRSLARSINGAARDNLFFQIALWTPVAALAIGLLYVASRLTALMVVLAILGWASAVASGVRGLPRRNQRKQFQPVPPETTA